MNRAPVIIGIGLIGLVLLTRKSRTSQTPKLYLVPNLIHIPDDAPLKIPKSLGDWIHKPAPIVSPAHDVLTLVNALRAKGGTCGSVILPATHALQWDERLAASAMAHARDMATLGYFAHVSPQGSRPEQRIQRSGWHSMPVGENIAAGQATPDEVMRGWVASPGHCVNLLRNTYSHIGVAYYFAPDSQYKHYWVQNFGG
jgi:uncharacterized protein YkwD